MRHRIGQDLHDSSTLFLLCLVSRQTSLGIISNAGLSTSGKKELREIQQISKESMRSSKPLGKFKSRTLTSEPETVKKMLEIAELRWNN